MLAAIRIANPWVKALSIALAALAWAVAAHMASANQGPSDWGVALALAPVVLALALALKSLPVRWLGILGTVVALAGLVAMWPWLRNRVALLFLLEQVGCYALLSVTFGRTLRGPGESLVTQMARKLHGGVLSSGQLAHSRNVTVAWSIFFAAMALSSVLLFLLAPTVVWSVFANLLGPPLIALMFVCEMIWRRWTLPDEALSSIADVVRAWKLHNTKNPP